MKPILLKITAFGPYAKQVELNFKEDLHYQDIFVITGPTGAGKTTIFDAICYGLYGETSGAKRKGEELRSDFSAKGDLRTEVEFTFSVKDKVYCIARAPKQQQKKKRGTGMTEVPATVELRELDSDRAPLTKDNEVRQEIHNILGLNVDQFRKIVMIPQGDFKEFLFANTTSKEELLRKIFGTDLYKAIQEQLHEKAVSLKSGVAQIQKEIQAELSILNTKETPELQQLITEDSRLSVILEAIKDQIKQFNNKEVTWQETLTTVEKSLQEKNTARQEAMLLNEKIDQQEKTKQKLSLLEQQSPLFAAKEQELASAQQAQELLSLENEVSKQEAIYQQLKNEQKQSQRQLTEVQNKFVLVKQSYEAIAHQKQEMNTLIEQESQLAMYHQDVKNLKSYQEELQELKQKQEALMKTLRGKKSTLEDLTLQISPLEGHQTKLEQLKTQSFDLQMMKTTTEVNLKEVQTAYSRYQSWQQFVKEETLIKKQYDAMYQEAETLRENYDHQATLFVNAAAIRLANELQIGQACPVCGSTEHPNPSKTEEKILTQSELNHLRDELNQFNVNVQSCWQKVTSNQLKTEEEKRALMESYELIKQHQSQLENLELNEEMLVELKTKQEIALSEQTEQLKDLTNQKEQLQQEITHLLRLKEEQQQLDSVIKELEKTTQEHEVRYLTQQETLKSMLERIPTEYHSLDILEEKIKELQRKRQDLEKNICQSEADYQRVLNQLTVLQTTIGNLEKQIEQVQANLEEVNNIFQEGICKSFETKEHYHESKRSKEIMDQLTHGIQNYYQEMHTASHLLKELANDLEGKKCQDVNVLNEQISDLDRQKEEIRKEMTSLQMRRQHFEQVLTSTMKKYNLIQRQEEQYAVVGELAELANGRTAGKMSFETYVLSSYFDEVLEAANQRLNKMTGGRYYLLRREEVKGGGRKGLDLDVYDSHTCKKRPVNTLSGGESFKASLALALGLSDTVQQTAGGIQLDTMFIDEGFGTLDSDSLEQAIDILMDLQDHGRLIGVISHVNELKERIPAKLVVQSSPEGSTAYFRK